MVLSVNSDTSNLVVLAPGGSPGGWCLALLTSIVVWWVSSVKLCVDVVVVKADDA